MAVETALKFLERMDNEDSLRTQLYVSNPEDIKKLSEFARGKGFVVSVKDLATALEQFQSKLDSGGAEPLKKYLNGYKRLPASTSE